MKQQKDRYAKSRALLARAEKSLAGGVSSNVRKADKPLPLYFDHGMGSKIVDADGNEYIDYVLGRGPLILGHGDPDVLSATTTQLQRGQVYAAQHELEIELAERVVRLVPSAELVRFGISGSEAVHAALRLARAYTGRNIIVKFEGHYHGWLDNILYSLSPSTDLAGDALHPKALSESRGQLSAENSKVVVLPWNNVAVLEEFLETHGRDVAAVITEPVMCNTGVILPAAGYLEAMRALCTKHGVVLIFDEVITGFRVSVAGAQGFYDVSPDLSIFGKAIANGLPMSCLAGRAEVMSLIARGDVVHGGTYNSLPPAIAAGVATLDLLSANNAAIYQHIWSTGIALMKGIRDRAAKQGIPVIVQGYPAVFYVAFPQLEQAAQKEVVDYRSSLAMNQDLYSEFVCALADRGVRVIPRGNWFLSAAHRESDVEQTLSAVEESMIEVAAPYYLSAGAARS